MKSRVIVKMSGGLGNQLFQWVFVRYLQKELRRDISIDLSDYGATDSLRAFDLPNLGIIHDVSEIESSQIESTLQELIWAIQNRFLFHFTKGFKTLIHFFTVAFNMKVIPHFKWDSKLTTFVTRVPIQHLFIGNWQEPRFLERLGTELSDEFELKRIAMTELYGPLNFDEDVAIHVRRGDYLDEKSIHTVLPLDYYIKAISILEDDSEVRNFVIFSDDPEWCRLNIKSKRNINFFSDLRPGISLTNELLYFMSFKRKIISNSTFSLFPALLSRGEEKKVVVPNSWFKNSQISSPRSFYSEAWIVI